MLERTSDREPLAIVGIGLRLPGNNASAAEYWNFLKAGLPAVSEIPDDRWQIDNFYSENPGAFGKARTKWGGFITGVRDFDAEFFGISPAEAEMMDPQQRLLLMTSWEAFEDAGISPERLKGSNTAVYVGIQGSDYATIQRLRRSGDVVHTGTGGALSIAANRLSHKFDFHGPSVAIDTACSSSLVATDAACETLWRGVSDLAIAAGVNICLDPMIFINFSKANMLSPTGRCRTFDADADGYVRGEGVGAVILKRMSDAIADGDRIYALIRATCVNQDGYTSTITIPSAEAQREMLIQACARARLSQNDIDFVEAHGTGTPVGDPIEAHAIGTAFGAHRNRRRRVIVGAGKTVTGHLESAAGINGLIKTSLSLYHREIPKNLNFKAPNPNIPFDDLGLDLPLEHRAWDADNGRPRRAAVNSFGFGGTNACAILEEAPAQAREMRSSSQPYRRIWMMPLGAQSEKALGQLAGQLGDTLESAKDERDADATAANMALRRAHLSVRGIAIAPNANEAAKVLKSARKLIEQNKSDPRLLIGRKMADPRAVMAFAGQGGTWWGMAHGLMKEDAVFREAVEEVDDHFVKLSGWRIADELLRSENEFRESSRYQVPCLFALQVGLIARWRAWGIEPAIVIGHSSGEMAAAYCAGINSLSDILKVVWQRGRLQETQEGRGGIATVGLSRSEMQRRLIEWGFARLEIAAVNGPAMVNIAGNKDEVALAVKKIQDVYGEDFFVRQLRLSFSPHTFHMDAIQDEFIREVGKITPKAGEIPMVSTVTGRPVFGQMVDASYWWRNIRDTVQFDQGLREAQSLGGNVFLEIGPHANLSAMISASLSEAGTSGNVVTSLKRGVPHDETLVNALATLYTTGIEPDWTAFYGPSVPRIELPAYPWEKKQFWIDAEELRWGLHGPKQHPLLGVKSYGPAPSWSKDFSLEELTYLQDHVVDGAVVYPGAGYIEMMIAVAHEVSGEGAVELENVEIFEAMMLSHDRNESVQTVYEPSRGRVTIYSRPRGSNIDWVMRARCRCRVLAHLTPPAGTRMKAPKGAALSRAALYKKTAARGFAYGPKFRGVKRLWSGERHSVAEVIAQESKSEEYFFHPGHLDSVLHAGFGLNDGGLLGGTKADGGDNVERLYLPVRFERMLFYCKPPKAIWVEGYGHQFDDTQSVMDLTIDDTDGNRICDIEGFTARALNVRKIAKKNNKNAPRLIVEDWAEAEPKLAQKRKPARGQTWLVFREKNDLSLSGLIASSLAAAGAKVISVVPGKATAQIEDGLWTADPSDPMGFDPIMASVYKKKRGAASILFGWGVSAAEGTKALDTSSFDALEARSTIAALHLTQALNRQENAKSDLWFLTRGVIPTGDDTVSEDTLPAALAGAPLMGMVRTIRTELESHRCRVLDLDPVTKLAKAQAQGLSAVLCGDTDESEIALRGSRWFVPRLRDTDDQSLDSLPAPANTKDFKRHYRLSMSQPGDLDNLRLIEAEALTPGEGQIKIDVKAGGLNFRDVMAATGLLPADAETGHAWQALGLECAGVVTAVGKGVKGFKPGDRIMGSAKGCFRSEALIRAEAAFILPKQLTFSGATTIPSAFGTAYFALHRLARVQPGESVLIHMGTGGVGLAAIQIARHFKAKVISTAGSKDKRDYLKTLGVEHVFDSRSLNFSEDVRRVTKGRGVDIVLNALAGEAIPLAVNLMAPSGRFIEIGKRDIYDDSALGLRPLRKNLAFFALDMARMDQDDPAALAEVYAQILDLFAKGSLKPLPVMAFKASQAIEAFKTMAQARHIGKVVIDFEEPDVKVGMSAAAPLRLTAEGAFVVSGGLGGFGARVAEWLAEHGARHLYLLGRSGASRPEAQALLQKLKESGVKARAITCDVTNPDDISATLAQIAKDQVPLKGVIHSAMVLDDGYLNQLTGDRMMAVLRPKALGAWNLHEATKDLPLDYFVMFSSFAAVLGSPGQANYVAANRFLDILAMHRKQLGLPALSINWGALAGAGAVARNKKLAKYLKSMGMPAQEMDDTLHGLSLLMRKDVANAGFARVDWQALGNANGDIRKTPRFADVSATVQGQQTGGRIRNDLLSLKGEARETALRNFVAQQIARVLKVDANGIDYTRPLTELGLDSLTAFQLKNKMETEIGIALPVTKFLGKPTLTFLAATILDVFEASLVERKQGRGTTIAGGTKKVLSPRQEDLWRAIKQDGAHPRHTLQEHVRAIRVSIEVDQERLNTAVKAVAEAHEQLRAVFPSANGEPSVSLLPVERFRAAVIDTTNVADSAFAAFLNERNIPLDVTTGPLFQVALYRRPSQASVIVVRSHAIASDLTGFDKAAAELFQHYFSSVDRKHAVAEKRVTYFDFAPGHRAWIESDDGRKAAVWWGAKLKGLAPQPQIGLKPAQSINPSAKGFMVTRYMRREGDIAAPRAIARDLGVSLHALMAGAIHSTFYALSGATDVVVTTNVSNRLNSEYEELVGYFANTVLIRSGIDPARSFAGQVQAAAVDVVEAMEFSALPVSRIVKAAAQAGTELSPHFFGLTPLTVDTGERTGFERIGFEPAGQMHRFGELEIGILPSGIEGAGHSLNNATLMYDELDGDMRFVLHSREGFLDAAGAERFLSLYIKILRAALNDPSRNIGSLADGT